MSRLPARDGERIDRSIELAFRFEGRPVRGFAGDTIGSALYASGRRVFSRSFKYHRPRGLLCCTGACANCMMTVDGVPNVRVCVEPLRAGADVRAQNVVGSLEHDLLAVVDRVGGPFTPVGFYYRTLIRPRRAWPVYERVLRAAAGLGRVGGATHRRYDVEHRRVDVLVIGGGPSGRRAAAAAAAEGRDVVLVDERPPARRSGRVRGPRAGARDRDLRGRPRPGRRRRRSAPVPGREDRRRDRLARAAAALPGERPRRRRAAVGGPAPRGRLGPRARDACGGRGR